MKWLGIIFITLFILSCSTKNNVKQITSERSVIKYQESQTDEDIKRFSNLYPGEKTYPFTCTDNCYPNTKVVKCQSTAEDCIYVGKQQSPNLETGFNIRWLGHASFYIESPDGSSLLIDPVSKQFDWPVNWAFKMSEGFNRNPATWPSKQELASVDAVMYSHIHYDHFNKDDIKRLGTDVEYFSPLAFGEHFPNGGFNINEMSWYSTKKVGDLDIHFVPAHHFSSRIWVPYVYEDNEMTLWGGWIIEYQGKRIFFAGDTGYSDHFKDIYQQYGDMDVCLIPIASYFHEKHANWYRYVHTTPEDALVAAAELKCKVMIPWGYGNASWKMGDRSSHSPLLRLLHMHKQLNSTVPLHILNEGEEITL